MIVKILAVLIVLLFMVWLFRTMKSKEKFMIYPYVPRASYNFTRMYPGIFSVQWPGNIRYNPSYRDYWYIPAHEYLDYWFNGPGYRYLPNECVVPASINESCVDAKLSEKGMSIQNATNTCYVPASISESCPLLRT